MIDEVTSVISSVIGIDGDKINECSDFITELAVNSLQRIQLIDAFEDKFGITLNVREHMPKMRNVNDICNIIEELRK